MLLAALKGKGIAVDQSIPALPEAAPAAMPAEEMENAGYYGSTAVQYRVAVSADGTLTLHYMNYPTSVPDQAFTYCADGTFRDSTGTALLRFVRESNGETYLYQKAVSQLPGLGALPVSNYAAVKLPANRISAEVQDLWTAASAMSVLPVREKYSSQAYLAMAAARCGRDTGGRSRLLRRGPHRGWDRCPV